jgi:hypothetical protein
MIKPRYDYEPLEMTFRRGSRRSRTAGKEENTHILWEFRAIK